MKITFNFRSGVGPLTLELPGEETDLVNQIKSAIEKGEVLDFTDTKGDRVVIPAEMIGYVIAPTTAAHKVGFGRL